MILAGLFLGWVVLVVGALFLPSRAVGLDRGAPAPRWRRLPRRQRRCDRGAAGRATAAPAPAE